MKRYFSVFEMITRSTFYKVLGIMALMMGAQVIMFYQSLCKNINDPMVGMEHIVTYSRMGVPMAIAFVLISLCLCMVGCNFGSKQSYTLRRLQIKEESVFGLQFLYNLLCYVMFWVSQVSVFLICGKLYASMAKGVTNQTLVLAFCRSEYMSSVFPVANRFGWLYLVVFIWSCAYFTAIVPFYQRRGKLARVVYLLGSLFFVFFIGVVGHDLLSSFIVAIIAYITVLISRMCEKIEKGGATDEY